MKIQRPRKVDVEALAEAMWVQELNNLEKERRQRRNAYLEMGCDIPRPHRQLGRTDITDLPVDVPWQQIVLDDLGVLYPVNKNWFCPNCGQECLSSFPNCGAPRCSRCGYEESPLTRINKRR